MRSPFSIKRRAQPTAPSIYLADNSPYFSNPNSRDEDKTVVTGTFPASPNESRMIETIWDPGNPGRRMFLAWENGNATIHDHIERGGRIFVPEDSTSNFYPSLSLPDGLLPCGEPASLHAQIASTIAQFVKISEQNLFIVASIVLTSWFPDCFQAIPYLWVVGPLNSGKTTLLKLMSCFCRRALIAGDLRGASVYKLADTWNPTLIIDELELGTTMAAGELNRLLRTGSMPGVPAIRNGQRFETYGLKIISSRQPPSDVALLSRGFVVPMLPAADEVAQLCQETAERIAKEFQAKLLRFRLTNYSAVKNFSMPPNAFPGPSSRIKQLAHALSAPFLGETKLTEQLFTILREADEDARVERFLEPEWLVGHALFDMCHDDMLYHRFGARRCEIYIGGLAARIDEKLKWDGEDVRLGARKVGAVLKCLGLRTERLDRCGRGLKVTSALKRRIHEIARQLGIDRRTIAPSGGLEAGNGGTPCSLCEEFGLTAGLRFVSMNQKKFPVLTPSRSRRSSLFEKLDSNGAKNLSGAQQQDD
jgi:hypothetical protein